ncbi:MAG: hypothetical protein WC004_01290, partial [Candidatus Absconditabacterales bacterium]
MKKIIGLFIIGIIVYTPSYITLAQDATSVINDQCQKKCESLICSDETCTPDDYENCDNSCKAEKQAEYNRCKQVNTEKDCLCILNGGIKLNTNFPFIGRCIEKSSDGKAIAGIAGVFTNILMTLIITIGFGMVIRGGVQFAMNKPAEGKKTIMNVVIAFAALGSLGIILRLI